MSHLVADLGAGGPGLSPRSGSGIYAPLRARSRLVGLLAVERRVAGSLDQHDLALMDGVAEQAALAVDNARWFSRLRRVGADEERNRIARDLHDRVGQSLAYLAFELDRVAGRAAKGDAHDNVTPDLERLRDDMRQVVSEVRETLYDLRTGVSDEHRLVDTLEGFLDRVRQRRGIEVTFNHDNVRATLPLPLEREFWRIAQEAVTNAERHSGPTRIDVFVGRATTPRPCSRSATTAGAWPAPTPVAPTPTASSGCASGPTPSAPRSSSSHGRTRARRYAAACPRCLTRSLGWGSDRCR